MELSSTLRSLAPDVIAGAYPALWIYFAGTPHYGVGAVHR